MSCRYVMAKSNYSQLGSDGCQQWATSGGKLAALQWTASQSLAPDCKQWHTSYQSGVATGYSLMLAFLLYNACTCFKGKANYVEADE